MPKKKVDPRVRTLIENGVQSRTRSFFVLVGDRGKDQVVNLHYILSKAQVKSRPSVLWCYNKELGFSTCVPRRAGWMRRTGPRTRKRNPAVSPPHLLPLPPIPSAATGRSA